MKWGEYRLGDLFEIESSKKIFHANELENIYNEQVKNSLPYVVRTTQDNWVRWYIIEDETNANDGNTLSFAQDTFSVFYQRQNYFTGNKVKVLKSKFEKSSEWAMHFITACFQKSLNNLTWGTGSTVETIAETKIQLPTKNWEIDFEFMECFIEELESQKIQKLDEYLETNWFKDCTLTSEEEKVLRDFESGKVEWREFSIVEDIFNVKNTWNILARDITENSWVIPYLCASSENNGVSSYISYDEKLLDKGNCIFIWGKTFVVSYQENDFYSNDSHNLVLYLKDVKHQSKLKQLFLASCIFKWLGHKYSWGDSISNKKIQKDKISLPAKNNKPEYELMETLISAIQKLVIRDMVAYVEGKMEKSK